MLCDLNFCNVLCQLHLNDAGGGETPAGCAGTEGGLWCGIPEQKRMQALNLSCGNSRQADTKGQYTQQLASKNVNVPKNRKQLRVQSDEI